MAVDLCIAYNVNTHARFDDLDLDARSQFVDKDKKLVLNYFYN